MRKAGGSLEPARANAGARTSCEACAARSRSVCAAVSLAELPRLASVRRDVLIGKGEAIFREGDEAGFLFNITAGVVKLSKLLSDGRQQITGFLFPGDFLGFAFLNRYGCTAEAVTGVRLCQFPRRAFEALLDDFPALEREMLQRASHELAAAQEQMLLLGRKSAEERLATFLQMMAERIGGPDGAFELPMSREEIADFLGLTVETISRTMTRLRKGGVLALPSPQQVVLLDQAGLAAASGVDLAYGEA